MSSHSSTSSDDNVKDGKRLRRKIDFDLAEASAGKVMRSLPSKRSKQRWYSPVNVCGSVPRFDRTLRPLRLIDEDRNLKPLCDNIDRKGKEKVRPADKPYVISIPSSPSPTPPLSPPYFRSSSPRSPISFGGSSPRTPFSFKGSSLLSPFTFKSPTPWRSIANKFSSKNASSGKKRCERDSGDRCIALNLMMEKLTLLEDEVSLIKMRPQCPCLECRCCFISKSPLGISHKGENKGKHFSGATTSLGQPPRRRYLYERFTPQNLLDIVAFHGWFFSRQPWITLAVPVPNKESGGVPRLWFRSLYARDQWLIDEGALTGNEYSLVRGLVQPYAEGDIPNYVGREWSDIDTIYGVGNIEGCHWVLYVVSLRDRRITVYDSSYSPESWARLLGEFDTFTRNLGRLLVSYGGLRNLIYPPQFEVIRYVDAPQQINDYDCGIMVLEYFRFLVSGRRVEELDPYSTEDQRIYFCSMLFKFGRETTTRNGGVL